MLPLSYRIAMHHLEDGFAALAFPAGSADDPAVGVLGLRSRESRLFTEHPDPHTRVSFMVWATVHARRAALDEKVEM